MRSRSGGASTSRSTIASGRLGAKRAEVLDAGVAVALAVALGPVRPRSAGPYWVNIVITQRPSSVSVVSIAEGSSAST